MSIDLERDHAPERRGTNSSKWDGMSERFGRDDLLSFWIADMDFQVADSVQKALQKMVNHGIYGYSLVPDSYYQAFIDWEQKRHGYKVEKQWLRFSEGVVAGVCWIINMMTKPGDSCLVMSPTYYPFMDTVRDTGRRLVFCNLINKSGVYSLDIKAFEKAIIENQVKLYIHCSPHNPTGRVWLKEEHVALMEICKKHGVFVISDEIHQDIVIGENKHITTALSGNYDDMMITLTSASKTFNLAGCQNSYVIIPDENNRKIFDKYVASIKMQKGSSFGYVAVEAAFREGEEWFEEVLKIIRGNYLYMRDVLNKELPDIVISPLEGTYLMWIDLGAYVPHKDIEMVVQEKCKLAVDYGDWFMPEKGDTHIRINLATPRKNIKEAAYRLAKEINSYIDGK